MGHTLAGVVVEQGRALQVCLGALERYGLLLLSDATLPSVCSLIVGEPLRRSWWGHPLGGAIYHVSCTLEDSPEVLATKLVDGKVTYVHRRLWAAVHTVGSAREDWQTVELSRAARWLLAQTDALGEVQTNDVPVAVGLQRKDLPAAARVLERRLLVVATEIHTPSGAHAKVLETWPHWRERIGFRAKRPSLTEAKRHLEEAVDTLSPGAAARLPWSFSQAHSR
jgi:hypothetical protein